MTTRLDVLKIDDVKVTPQGFLKFPVYAGRVGIQIYRGRNGEMIKEFRPEEEVFSESTLESLKNIPVTNEHPEDMVNLDNAKELLKGFGSDTVEIVDRKFQKTFVTITDKDLIDEIQNGKVEVSLGYNADVEEAQGEYEGMPYDAIQRNIVCNHLAVVTKGRAGPEVRLRLDRFDGIDEDHYYIKDKQPTEETMKIKIGDKEFEVSDECGKAFADYEKEMKDQMAKMKEDETAMEKEKEKAEDEMEEEKKKNDALQAKLDQAIEDGKKRIDSDKVNELVKERRSVESKAEKFLDEKETEKMDSMSNIEIKKAVISATTKKEIDLSSKSEAYIDARFDAIVDQYADEDFTFKQVKTDDKNDFSDSEKKRQERMKKDSEAWKEPIGRSLK